MRPIQVWLPLIYSSPAAANVARDRDRAYTAWRGESTVYLMPGLAEPKRWTQNDLHSGMAIPAEHIDAIEVFHVGANGQVWGPGCSTRFPNGRIDGLLLAWLNALRDGIEWNLLPETIELGLPQFDGDHVFLKMTPLRLTPIATLPLQVVDSDSRRISLSWPPPGWPTPTVSLDSESAAYYGPVRREARHELPVGFPARFGGGTSLCLCSRWPESVRSLISIGAGLDEFHALHLMTQILNLSSTDPESAIAQARAAASAYLTEARSSRLLTEFWPTCIREGEENALADLETKQNVSAANLADAMNSEKGSAVLKEEVPVLRAWGVVGFFYALLLDALESKQPVARCARCGRAISGTKRKRYCSESDDRSCFTLRRRTDRRRLRARQETGGEG